MVMLCSSPVAFGETSDAGTTNADQTWDYVEVLASGSDPISLDVAVVPFNCTRSANSNSGATCQQLHLIAKDTVVQERVKQLQKGDRIRITFESENNNQNVLKQFCLDTMPPVSSTVRTTVLLTCAVVCFLISAALTRSNPLKLTIGEDGRYSNSKIQIAIWFFVLITSYLSTLWLRAWYGGCDFIGGINVPHNLLLVSGLSVISFAGAKAITTSKVADAESKSNGNADPKNSANAKLDFFQNLTHNDGQAAANAKAAKPPQLDFGDFQMLIVTLIAVGTYLLLVFNYLGVLETSKLVSLPDLDTTVLAAFGLGQGAYLAKKAAGDVGES